MGRRDGMATVIDRDMTGIMELGDSVNRLGYTLHFIY